MTTKEMLKQLLEGKKMAQVDWQGYRYIYLDDTTGRLRYISKDETHYALAVFDDDKIEWKEYQEPVLTFKEKAYLSAVIKPFRDEVDYIYKLGFGVSKDYITLSFKNGDLMDFPLFNTGTMYKGMEVDKKYTLEELGL